MADQNRRNFLTTTLMVAAGMATYNPIPLIKKKAGIIHHVLFWLKNPSSQQDKEQLIKGLETLRKIETVKKLYIGVPASTEQRDVIDKSYHVSELMFFDDLKGQEIYQQHPVHQQFIKENLHLWEKVVVYDVEVKQ
ncbi:MAG: Dabb family protein [Chitinophagaceae bacterium]